MRLAIYNFGLFRASYDSDLVEGFRLREPFNFAAAEAAEGFVGRSGYEGETGPACWGPQVFPRFIKGSGFETAPSSLSLWTSLEALMAFTYSGVHADALKHARIWQVEKAWPALVLWWVPKDRLPTWAEGVERFEHLHDHGPSPHAFHFKKPYDCEGQDAVLKRDRVREMSARNIERQRDMLTAVGKLKV
ncbi:DUF3291 domain-containing protein [Rhizobium sp. PAMB 3182]